MRLRTTSLLLALPALVAACSPDSAPSPLAPAAPMGARTLSARSGNDGAAGLLLACPSDVAISGEAVIGREGGSLVVGGHALVVPAGAVPKPTTFVLSVPASPVLEIDISGDGRPHYQFMSPVAVRVDYSRCADDVLPETPLVAWWIDGPGRSKQGEMPSTDDRAARTLTFTTDHLSGYAIAYRSSRGEGEGEGGEGR